MSSQNSACGPFNLLLNGIGKLFNGIVFLLNGISYFVSGLERMQAAVTYPFIAAQRATERASQVCCHIFHPFYKLTTSTFAVFSQAFSGVCVAAKCACMMLNNVFSASNNLLQNLCAQITYFIVAIKQLYSTAEMDSKNTSASKRPPKYPSDSTCNGYIKRAS